MVWCQGGEVWHQGVEEGARNPEGEVCSPEGEVVVCCLEEEVHSPEGEVVCCLEGEVGQLGNHSLEEVEGWGNSGCQAAVFVLPMVLEGAVEVPWALLVIVCNNWPA